MTAELDKHGYLIDWRERRERLYPDERPEVAALLRSIMDWIEAPKYCRRKDCRRAASCRAYRVDCAFQHLDLLQEHVFPVLHKGVRARGGIDAAE